MGVKKMAIPALATAGGAGAGAGGAYATGSYLSQSSVKSDAQLETVDQSRIPSSSTLGTDNAALDFSKKSSVSVITNEDYKKKYSDHTSIEGVTAGECSKDIFNISDFKKGSDSDTTTSEKGCLYVDVQKSKGAAVLVTIEMTLMKDNKGLIFGTKIYNAKTSHEITSRQGQKAPLRQDHWSLKVEKEDSKWKVKEGWRWGRPIFSSSEETSTTAITLQGSAVGGEDVVVSLSSFCHIDVCSTSGSMESVLNKKYKWTNEDSSGQEMFEFLAVSLSGFSDSIPYWTGKKLIFDESNEGDNVDGSFKPSAVDSEDISKCEQNQNDARAPSVGRIFYTQKWSEQNWKKEVITEHNAPFVLTACAFDVAKGSDGKFQTVKFKWNP